MRGKKIGLAGHTPRLENLIAGVQLIDARERCAPMKRSLADKRRCLDQAALDAFTREDGALDNSKTSRVSDNTDFGYRRIAARE